MAGRLIRVITVRGDEAASSLLRDGWEFVGVQHVKGEANRDPSLTTVPILALYTLGKREEETPATTSATTISARRST